jgi:hypothetical protein
MSQSQQLDSSGIVSPTSASARAVTASLLAAFLV